MELICSVQALRAAKASKKDLLVNIQDPQVFESHLLNRDVWKNEVVSWTRDLRGPGCLGWRLDPLLRYLVLGFLLLSLILSPPQAESILPLS